MAAEIAGRLAGCPSAEELQRFQEGTLGNDERHAIDRHASRCAPCAAGLTFLRQARQDAEQDAVELPESIERRSEKLIALLTELAPRRTFKPRAPLLAAYAALGLLVVLAVVAIWTLPSPIETAPRAETEKPLQPLQPRGRCGSPPEVFRWSPDPRASRYRVTVHGGDRPDLRLDTQDAVPLLILDSRTREELTPGVEYSWSVATLDPRGKEIGHSREARFAVAARKP